MRYTNVSFFAIPQGKKSYPQARVSSQAGQKISVKRSGLSNNPIQHPLLFRQAG
jgi:hypothetical protein